MNNEKTRYLYAILKKGGTWGVVTSTEPLSSALCFPLTPVNGYPVTVTYRTIENGVTSVHQVVCENSNMLGTLLNGMGIFPETYLLETIWDYNVHEWQTKCTNIEAPHIGDVFLKQFGVLKAYLDKDESGRWVVKLGRKAPERSLLLSVIDEFPVTIDYSSSDANGSSNYREVVCETAVELLHNLHSLFSKHDQFFLHAFAHYNCQNPISHEVYKRLNENLKDNFAEEKAQASFERYVFAKESLIDFAVNQLIEVLTKTDVESDFEGSLTEDIAEAVGSILAEKGIEYCHPIYLKDSIPCYETDVCGNTNCPFRRKN